MEQTHYGNGQGGESRHGVAIPAKLSDLRSKLNHKAKCEPEFRFYAVYDRIYRIDTLMTAWELVKTNKGSAGVDGVKIETLEKDADAVLAMMDSIYNDLRAKTYKPQPVLRVYIPKANGKMRPLGIPTVRDRVVQTAALLILEPIFEADFLDCSYGFRPGRSAHQALEAIRQSIKAGKEEIYDADLEGYFDSIPHDKLMKCVEVRIADRNVLKLIRMWLTAPVLERDSKLKTPKRPDKGTPQGGVISPLLANIYLHWFDKVFHGENGLARIMGAVLVRYADDFVIMTRRTGQKVHAWVVRLLEGKFGLKINGEKTKVVKLGQPGAALDFLGYRFRFEKDLYGKDQNYLNVFPSQKSMKREMDKLRSLTDKSQCFTPIPALIERLNRHLKGWANYFSFGYPRRELRRINWFVRTKLWGHLRRRSQRRYRPPKDITFYKHLDNLGLVYL